MIALVLFALVMTTITSTYLTFAKHSTSMGNYTEMSMDSRYALEVLGRDIHAANSITKATTSQVTLTMPTELGGSTVDYTYDSTAKTLTRTITDASSNSTSRVLFDNLDSFGLNYFNRTGIDVTGRASILNEAKSVQLDARLLRKLLTVDNTDYVISAKFLIRNL